MDRNDFPKAFAECDHLDHDYEPSDPGVGYFGPYWLCNDCGSHADHATPDYDEDGLCGETVEWQEPRFADDAPTYALPGSAEVDAALAALGASL
jgi:hypothetical protein